MCDILAQKHPLNVSSGKRCTDSVHITYYRCIPQWLISQQESFDLNVISFSLVLQVGGEGHSLGLQATACASVQVHWWQLDVHVSPTYRDKPC